MYVCVCVCVYVYVCVCLCVCVCVSFLFLFLLMFPAKECPSSSEIALRGSFTSLLALFRRPPPFTTPLPRPRSSLRRRRPPTTYFSTVFVCIITSTMPLNHLFVDDLPPNPYFYPARPTANSWMTSHYTSSTSTLLPLPSLRSALANDVTLPSSRP
jgi:hypothetical protein